MRCLLERYDCFSDERIVNGAEGVDKLRLSRWYVRHVATAVMLRRRFSCSSVLVSQHDADLDVLDREA
jgi:hypothetical protein